jgi:hypothetical protein
MRGFVSFNDSSGRCGIDGSDGQTACPELVTHAGDEEAPDESRMDTVSEYSVLSRGPVLPFRPLRRTRHRGLAGPVRTAVTRVSGTLEEL